ncbi:hypothetical protein AALA54_15610 [Oscillospiraceae bacterium 44-34]
MKGGWRHAEAVHHITNRPETDRDRRPEPRGGGLFLFDRNTLFMGEFTVLSCFPTAGAKGEIHRFS